MFRTFRTTGVYDVGRLWRYVPSLFVMLGAWAIVQSGFRNLAGPAILIVVAGTVQLLALDLVTGDTIATWWPLLVVLPGLSILVGHRRRRSRVPTTSADGLDLVGVFGGVELRVPEEREIAVDALPMFGAIEDERRRPPADAVARDGPDLVVTGLAAFGGVSING